jgi:hypothetical protein
MTTIDGTLRLHTTLEPRGPAAAIVLTDEQVAVLGAGKAFPVQVTINGTTVAARVARMGGENLLGLSKKLRADLGVEIGAAVDAIITVEDAPRQVLVPPALAAALTLDPTAETAFEALAPSHRREFARWIDEAKREDTRTSRVAQTVQMLREGRTRQ